MSTGNVKKCFCGLKCGRCVELTTLPPSMSRCLASVGSLTFHNPIGLHGLLRELLYFFTFTKQHNPYWTSKEEQKRQPMHEMPTIWSYKSLLQQTLSMCEMCWTTRYSKCRKSSDTPATCALCGGPHPANYRGFEHYHWLYKVAETISTTWPTNQQS
jgi:hypothetical protein